MTRMAIIASLVSVASIDPALAQPLYCSVWQGIRTCSSPGGYVSHESVWNGITTGDDNQGRETIAKLAEGPPQPRGATS